MSEQLNRDFVLIDNPIEAQTFLKEAAKTAASTILWTKDHALVIHTHVSALIPSDHALYCWIPKDLDPQTFNDQLAELKSDECYFSISLSRAVIFFKTKFRNHDAAGFKFDTPTELYKVQRRKHLRYTISDGFILKVEFEAPLFPGRVYTRKVIDISAGGLAFLTEAKDEGSYPNGMPLNSLRFNVKGREIVSDAIIRHSRILEDDLRHKGLKVGVEFSRLPEKDSQLIASWVLEESRKYFSKMF